MDTTHPLLDYSRRSGTPLRQIAKDAGCSRMTLYRLIRGEQNATIGLIQRVAAATNGAVSAEDFFPQPTQPQQGSASA
jgi:DNA-binding phage protein